MIHIKKFENFDNKNSTLIIVDVQKSFRKFFTELYINELKKYCKKFRNVYQIWDNHHHGKNVDKDYLYDELPEIPIDGDLYHFPNQKDIIEKRYNYNVSVDFYKNILDKDLYSDIKNKEERGLLKKGNLFKTKKGTAIVYVGNNHKWYHIGKKLYDLLIKLSGQEVIIVGGADSECLEDISTAAESIGVIIKRNHKFIWSANHCPIK